jgi:hypothetical protein
MGFFSTFLFSTTVVHLTPKVDLTALHPSEGPHPSGRPGATNSLGLFIVLSPFND